MDVICGLSRAIYNVRSRLIELSTGASLSPAAFEKHAGLGAQKNWKRNVRVLDENGVSRHTMGQWLQANKGELCRKRDNCKTRVIDHNVGQVEPTSVCPVEEAVRAWAALLHDLKATTDEAIKIRWNTKKKGEGFALVEVEHAHYELESWHYVNEYVKHGSTRKFMHQFVMGTAPLGLVIDHINGDKKDNCRKNLRFATTALNNQNVPSKPDSSSQYKGVHRSKCVHRPWCASCKSISLGNYRVEEHAAWRYNMAAFEEFGEGAFFNIIQKPGVFKTWKYGKSPCPGLDMVNRLSTTIE